MEAAGWIDSAQQLSAAIPILRVANLDNAAQLALLNGDMDRTRDLVADLDAATALPYVEHSWYALPITHTKIRLHRALGNWGEVDALTGHAIAAAERREDSNAIALFAACRAECLAMLGRVEDALAPMELALRWLPQVTLSTLSEIDRAMAALLDRLGERAMAGACLARAGRIAECARDAVLRAEARRTLTLFEDGGQPPVNTAPSWILQLYQVLTSAARPEILESVLSGSHFNSVLRTAKLTAEPLRASAPDEAASSRRTGRDAEPQAARTALELIPQDDGLAAFATLLLRASVEAIQPALRQAPPLAYQPPRPTSAGFAKRNDILVSPSMLQLLDTAARIAATPITVLITGETGSGKEVFARFVHEASDRKNARFVAVNCSALSKDLLESQLFGHRRGAFTGASESFDGIVKGAEGGTLFLDEVGDLPLDLQPKFLRFLETGEVLPLGSNQPYKVDVRVLAATNANLTELVAAGRFRADLFYRLNGIHFHLPPLRSRRAEIPPLARHLLERYAAEFTKGTLTLTAEAMEHLLACDWPGNVRQLASELRRVAALADPDSAIGPDLFSDAVAPGADRLAPAGDPEGSITIAVDQKLRRALEHVERAMIARALEQSAGRVDEAAQLLGISRKGLFLKRRRYGIAARES